MHVAGLTFNPFQENTYIVYDDTKECIIFDPGMFTAEERKQCATFIEQSGLKPVRLINTHCHLDHVFGNNFIHKTYNLPLEIHEGELAVLQSTPQVCKSYGIPYTDPSPMPERFIGAGDIIEFGNTKLKAIFTPGHSPASLSFFDEDSKQLIAGDVLFYGSIGRTDLPGGDFATLISSIKEQLFPLGDDVKVYPGHGPSTSIGYERDSNPFLK
jgi:glyoxylase-like metal-dependent hydrolase (beta-lactamase superfamily II)